jgi:hypothetical protein
MIDLRLSAGIRFMPAEDRLQNLLNDHATMACSTGRPRSIVALSTSIRSTWLHVIGMLQPHCDHRHNVPQR